MKRLRRIADELRAMPLREAVREVVRGYREHVAPAAVLTGALLDSLVRERVENGA